MKSKKFQNSKFFLGKIFLDIKAVDHLNTVFFKNQSLELQSKMYEKRMKQSKFPLLCGRFHTLHSVALVIDF